jgi:hypothetical protein
VATNATAAPTETYQKNQVLWPMLLSHWMTSGAVPPNRATVRLYQVGLRVGAAGVLRTLIAASVGNAVGRCPLMTQSGRSGSAQAREAFATFAGEDDNLAR